jgi:hypothetical protein
MGMIVVASFIIAPIVGILLGLRFKVFVLVPATLLAAVAVTASGHQSKVTLALSLLGTVVLLQIGYLVGLIVRAHLQREAMPRHGDSVSTSIVRFSTWRAADTSKKATTAKAEKRHLVE